MNLNQLIIQIIKDGNKARLIELLNH